MNNLSVVYITVPSQEKAQEIVTTLLESNLIACATFFPCNSTYWWQGAIENDAEYVIIAKTVRTNYEQLLAKITAIHPYKVPCILKFDVEANQAYAQWVFDEINKK